jgi:hypothetical protein
VGKAWCRSSLLAGVADVISAWAGGQGADDDVVDVRVSHAVRAVVVLEGGDDPALRLDRGEPGQAGGLQEAERLVIG